MAGSTNVVLQQLRTEAARAFLNAVKNEHVRLYFFMGRANAWDSEASPPTVDMDVENHYDVWRGIYALRKINVDDVALVMPRVNWTKDTAYTDYDDQDATLYDDTPDFYVLTTNDLDVDDNKVYKCIDNNSDGDSTVEPDSNRTGVFGTTADENNESFDGYKWILMYQIEACDFEKFVSDDWVYVPDTNAADSLGEQACDDAVEGAVHRVLITAAGSGYTDGTHRLVVDTPDSDGSDFAADITVASGAVTAITILEAGQNYTKISLSMPSSAGSGSGATFRGIISPPGGHGSNAINELKPDGVLVYALVKGSESDTISVVNDFRQYGIVANPYDTQEETTARSEAYSLTYDYTITAPTNTSADPNFTLDEEIFVGPSLAAATAKARVLEWVAGANSTKIKLINVCGTFNNGDVLKGATSGTKATIVSTDSTPIIKLGSGEIVYLANQTVIARDDEQREQFQMTVEF